MQKTVDGARALIDLFWDDPVELNGDPLGYVINCTIDGTEERSTEVTSNTHTYSLSVKSGSVTCEIAARNEPNSQTFSEPITIDSSGLLLIFIISNYLIK